jgi:hypothetical protein
MLELIHACLFCFSLSVGADADVTFCLADWQSVIVLSLNFIAAHADEQIRRGIAMVIFCCWGYVE